MADWLSSMTQTFKFYEVDPNTWKNKRRISTVLSCNIKRDLSSALLESASFKTTEMFGECYIRVYLSINQNGVSEDFPLGTFLVQTPSTSFDGKSRSVTMDAYSPLLELRDKKPELGFSILKNANIMDNACSLTADNIRAPVVRVTNVDNRLYDNFTAENDESWLDFIPDLMSNAKYQYALDELSRVLFSPVQETESLQPVWTYTDDNSSILYPSITDEYDLYGIPNVVEVIYSSNTGDLLRSKIINDDPNSITSTVVRGREVVHRAINPDISGAPNQAYLDQYATQLLKNFNSVEHTITYSHGYCPVRLGDCVRLNYERAGIQNVKAKVIAQDIECSSGCVVSETAVYTSNLWRE